jgi:hypothetical protein
VSLKNADQGGFWLHDAASFWKWTIRLQDVKQRVTWTVRRHGKPPQKKGGIPFKGATHMDPGNPLNVSVDLEPTKEHQVDFIQDGMPDKKPLEKLPPGQYRLTITASFPDGFSSEGSGLWAGTITTNPVEFEIAAPREGGARAGEPAVKWARTVLGQALHHGWTARDRRASPVLHAA